MKIRYAQETSKLGLLVLEMYPQCRMLPVGGNNGFRRFAFPYMIFVVCYAIDGRDYVYQGIYGTGLQVFMRNMQLTSLDDLVYVSLTDLPRHGLVCTDHRYDNMRFRSPAELAKFVVDSWWNTIHAIGSLRQHSWQQISPENALQVDWSQDPFNAPQLRLRDAIERDYPKLVGYGLPKPIKLLDNPMVEANLTPEYRPLRRWFRYW